MYKLVAISKVIPAEKVYRKTEFLSLLNDFLVHGDLITVTEEPDGVYSYGGMFYIYPDEIVELEVGNVVRDGDFNAIVESIWFDVVANIKLHTGKIYVETEIEYTPDGEWLIIQPSFYTPDLEFSETTDDDPYVTEFLVPSYPINQTHTINGINTKTGEEIEAPEGKLGILYTPEAAEKEVMLLNLAYNPIGVVYYAVVNFADKELTALDELKILNPELAKRFSN